MCKEYEHIIFIIFLKSVLSLSSYKLCSNLFNCILVLRFFKCVQHRDGCKDGRDVGNREHDSKPFWHPRKLQLFNTFQSGRRACPEMNIDLEQAKADSQFQITQISHQDYEWLSGHNDTRFCMNITCC